MVRRHADNADAVAEIDALMPVVGLGADRGIVILDDGVVAERRDDAAMEFRGEARQRFRVEMVVVTVRHQHDVDRRQRVERDARIVHAHRARKGHR